MILHLGNDCFIATTSIIMILDYKEAVKNIDTSLFLKSFGRKSVCDKGKPKTIVITDDNKRNCMYISSISYKTLVKRSKTIGGVDTAIEKLL